MAIASRLSEGDRIRHPYTDDVVRVVGVRELKGSKIRVRFKAYGTKGRFDIAGDRPVMKEER